MAEDLEQEGFEEEDSVIVLENEDGEEVEFHHIATVDYKKDWYVLLQPVELGEMEEDELLIFKIESDEEGNDVFVPIEDEEVLEAVFAEFEKELEECEGCDCEDGECDCCHGDSCDCEEHN